MKSAIIHTDAAIIDVFEDVVSRNCNRPAVVDASERLTYWEFAERVHAYAAALPPKARYVGIVMDHGIDMIASLLAVLSHHAAYVPAEPDFPVERIRFMMEECAVDYIITQHAYADLLKGFPLVFVEDLRMCRRNTDEHDDGPACSGDVSAPVPGDAPAYVLYTSGSTGKPKGVVVSNRNVCHYAHAFAEEFHPTGDDVMLQYSVCSFDIFVEEVFATLLNGATLAIATDEARQDMQDLLRFVERHGVTIISGFPYLLLELNHVGPLPSCIRLLISGGDVLRERYVTNLLSQALVYNTYGPSETTVCATYFRCNGSTALEDGTYPIGHPVSGVEVFILDEDLRPVPPGTVGEICIAGDGVACGYLDASRNEMFVTDREGKRFYRSGDMGYELPDGDFAFLHRRDDQVMIWGKRVEAGEVENVLCTCEGVETAVVRPFTDASGLSYLVAYLVADDECGPEIDVDRIKAQMRRYLTPFMIPEFFVLVDHIPLTPNGKPDVKALPVVLKGRHV